MPAVTRAENPEEELSTEESRISLLVKVPAEDGTAVVEMTGPAVPENGLQAFGDWVLAALERRQGRYVDAEVRSRRALAIREKVLGPDHVDVATSLAGLAALYRPQSRYVEAEQLAQQFESTRAALLRNPVADHAALEQHGLDIFARRINGRRQGCRTGADNNHDGIINDRPAGVARNAMAGPGTINLDLNLSHDFPLSKRKGETKILTLSLNSFNVLNHPNYLTYIGTISSPLFGQPVAAQPPRRMQLDVQFKF